jgi:hypothetical protein
MSDFDSFDNPYRHFHNDMNRWLNWVAQGIRHKTDEFLEQCDTAEERVLTDALRRGTNRVLFRAALGKARKALYAALLEPGRHMETVLGECVELLRYLQIVNENYEQAVPQTTGDKGNILRLVGDVWHIRYEECEASLLDRADSVLRHLARLLAEPHRRFQALEFYPPPAGTAPLPHLGRDEASDDPAMKDYEAKMVRMIQEIKEADDAHDTETAEKLRTEFQNLGEHIGREKNARKRGHKNRCGTPSSIEKASQALRMGLTRLYDRFRKRGLEKLADHLEIHIHSDSGEWFYAPPGTFPWHVTRPEN